MRTGRWLACAACACAAASATAAFEAQARAKIAVDALRLAPPSLGRQLARHRPSLIRGAKGEFPATLAEAKRRLTEETEAAVSLINARRSFKKVSEALGRIAGIMACVNDPLWGESAPELREDGARFAGFFEDRMGRFPLVFNGYTGSWVRGGDLDGFIDSIRARYRDDRKSLTSAYHPAHGGPVRSSDFDDRSVPFAIASLAYSHAVTDAAHLWIHIWGRAHGDLSDTPYLADTLRGEAP